ncbi:MAG: nucleotidyltransferase domain-containing protein [Nitrospinae bacterium]|nr:nucleotidyltransferase domain-containing protein [Nitrospinota bacterium]
MAKINVNDRDLETVKSILRKYGHDREIWVFGSRLNGSVKKFADLDLAVMGEEPMPISTLAQMKEAFSESDLPFRVDIVEWARTSPQFRKIIAGAHEVLMGNTEK